MARDAMYEALLTNNKNHHERMVKVFTFCFNRATQYCNFVETI